MRSRWGTNPSRDDHDIEAVVCEKVLADEFAHATHGCQCDGLRRCCHGGGGGRGGDDDGCLGRKEVESQSEQQGERRSVLEIYEWQPRPW